MSIHRIKEKAEQLASLLREINANLPDDATIELGMHGGPSGIYVSVVYDFDRVREFYSNENTVGNDMYKALACAKKFARQADAVEASASEAKEHADES